MSFEGYRTMKFEKYVPSYRRIANVISKPMGTLTKTGVQIRLNFAAIEMLKAYSLHFRIYYDRESASLLLEPTVSEDTGGMKLGIDKSGRAGGLNLYGVIKQFDIKRPVIYAISEDFKTSDGICGFLLKPTREHSS